jgi:hypothetical protein
MESSISEDRKSKKKHFLYMIERMTAVYVETNESKYGDELWDKFQDGVDAAEDFIVFWTRPKEDG